MCAHRTPRRADLSQHFLRSRALASSLIIQAPVTRRDLVVEIGPGRGILTGELARHCREVVAVEFDRALCQGLRSRFRDNTRITIVQADFLRFRLPDAPYKVVGNIPFNRTAAIMRRLVQAPSPPDDAWLVVQREAGGAVCGRALLPGITVLAAAQTVVAGSRSRGGCNAPTSILLRMSKRSCSGSPAERDRSSIGRRRRTIGVSIRTCFGRGDHTIRRCLRSEFTRTQVHRLSRDLRFDPSGPPSSLTFDQWLALFRCPGAFRGKLTRLLPACTSPPATAGCRD